MVEVRPGSMKCNLRWGSALVLLLALGCSTPEGPDFGPDRQRHRELIEAQRARRELGTETATRTTTAGEKLAEGDQLRRSGDSQRALFRYLEALRLDPEDATARERIGYIHLEDDPDRARTIFEDVLEKRPSSVNAHLGLGLAQLSLGRLGASRAALETAQRLAPDSPEVLSALGSVYDRLGMRQQARQQLERARALRPNDPRILNNLGVAYLLSGERSLAERALREAVLLDPHDDAARNNLGLALGASERYEEALSVFREAGTEQAAQNNVGYCYFLNERYAEAVEHYERALMAEGEDDLVILENLTDARRAEAAARRLAVIGDATPTPPSEAPRAAPEATGEPTTVAPTSAPDASEPEIPRAEAPDAAREPILLTDEVVEAEPSEEAVDATARSSEPASRTAPHDAEAAEHEEASGPSRAAEARAEDAEAPAEPAAQAP